MKFPIKEFTTFAKAFLATVLSQYLIELQEGHQLFTGDIVMLRKLLTAGLVSNLPVLINWLNPKYKAYGRGKDE